jgi:hypothetical protein
VDSRPKVQDLDVWRAAQQVIDHHPVEPELAACQFADEAWEAGNASKFEYLMKVASAVRELIRTKPHVGKAIN